MNNFLKYLFACIILTSCGSKKLVIPSDVLDEKQMTEILTEVHLAQSAISTSSYSDSSKLKMSDYLRYIVTKNRTDKETFLKSVKFYSAHPEIMQGVYDSVMVNLHSLEK